MNKILIRLTESDLHRIVKESIQRIINSELLKEGEDSVVTTVIDGQEMTFKNSREYKKFMQKRKEKQDAEKGIKPPKEK